MASHGWLETLENTFAVDCRPRYVVLRDRNKLIAGTVCYLPESASQVPGLDDILFGRLKPLARKCGLSFLPSLICGPMNCVGKHLLLDNSLVGKPRELAIRQLLDALEHIASTEAVSLYFWNLFDDEKEILESLEDRGYRKTRVFPACYLDIDWSSFDEYISYLKTFSKNAAKQVRQDLNRNQKAGVRIERIRDVAPYQARLFELADAHWFKYNLMRYPYRPDFFSKVLETLGEGGALYGAFKASTLIGFLLLVRQDDTSYALEVGIDHELSQRDATYFNVAFYTPIRDAIDARTKKLYFGRGLPEPKMRRGCRRKNAYLYYRARNEMRNAALRPWFLLHSLWVRRKVRAQARSTPGPER